MKRYIFIRYDDTVDVSPSFDSVESFLSYTQHVRKEGTTYVKVKDNDNTELFSEQLKELYNLSQ